MNTHFDPLMLDIPREVKGERIVLRAYEDADADALWEAIDTSRAHLSTWMPWVKDHNDLEYTRVYIRRMQAKWILREDFVMGIWSRENESLLGATGFHRIDWSVPSLEIGYWVCADAEGQGYVTEAVKLITRFAFRFFHAERVTIMCSSKNARSAAVPRRAGFMHEATLRCERRELDGTLRDTELFAMTRADFESLSLSDVENQNFPE